MRWIFIKTEKELRSLDMGKLMTMEVDIFD